MHFRERLPDKIKRPLRPLWLRALRLRHRLRVLRWRAVGYADLPIGSHRFRFHDVGNPEHVWWAGETALRRWEPDVIGYLERVVRPGDVVFDIGAYSGPYALFTSRLVGPRGHVYAFEPDPAARKLLERNLATNGAMNVTVVPVAVSGEGGSLLLSAERLGGGGTTAGATGAVQVEAMTLTEFCATRGVEPDVVKMDVEGGEATILTADAAPILGRARAVIVEMHDEELAARGASAEGLRSFLQSLGPVLHLDERREGNYSLAVEPTGVRERARTAPDRR